MTARWVASRALGPGKVMTGPLRECAHRHRRARVPAVAQHATRASCAIARARRSRPAGWARWCASQSHSSPPACGRGSVLPRSSWAALRGGRRWARSRFRLLQRSFWCGRSGSSLVTTTGRSGRAGFSCSGAHSPRWSAPRSLALAHGGRRGSDLHRSALRRISGSVPRWRCPRRRASSTAGVSTSTRPFSSPRCCWSPAAYRCRAAHGRRAASSSPGSPPASSRPRSPLWHCCPTRRPSRPSRTRSQALTATPSWESGRPIRCPGCHRREACS